MNNGSASISPPSLASAKHVAPSAAARTKLLLEGPILTTLLRLAAPNILNLLAFAGVITFDGFFLGRIGTNALAGASLAFPWVMMVLQTTNSGMGLGVSSAIARALGAGRRDRADALVFHAFLLALAIAALNGREEPAMVETGASSTERLRPGLMSHLPLKADIDRCDCHVRFVPLTDIESTERSRLRAGSARNRRSSAIHYKCQEADHEVHFDRHRVVCNR
jgi:MatE